MILSSPAFLHNAKIPKIYTCDGVDINPPLLIQDVPSDANSLALVVQDNSFGNPHWIHWLLWNIPPTTTEILENSVPITAIIGINDFQENKWGGPCPPHGTHHYNFKLLALSESLKLFSNANYTDFISMAENLIIETSDLICHYERSSE